MPGTSWSVRDNAESPAQQPMKKSRIVFLKTPTPLLAAMISLALLPCLPCRSADWPNWRGLNQAGIWEDVRLPEKFGPETVTTSWRVKIGGGYSGVAVSNGRVLTMDRPEGKETERVICLDAKTGGTLWQWEYKAAYGDLSYNNGSRATPTVNEDFVYSLGATGLIHCLALSDGKNRVPTNYPRKNLCMKRMGRAGRDP